MRYHIKKLIKKQIIQYDNNKIIMNELNGICIDNRIYRFENESASLTDQENERATKIKKILQKLAKNKELNKSNKKKELNDLFKEQDEYLFGQPWNKLSEYHKTMKIKEYVAEKYKDEHEDLCECLLRNIKYLTNKNVNYDPEKKIIIELSCIVEDDNKISLKFGKTHSK